MRQRKLSTWRKIKLQSAMGAQSVVNGENYGTHYAQQEAQAWGIEDLWMGKHEGQRSREYVSRRQLIDMPKRPTSAAFGKKPLSKVQIGTIFLLMFSAGMGIGLALIMLT